MPTTFTLPASGVPAKTPGVGSVAVTAYAELALTVAPVINDVYQMIKVPLGARILAVTVGADDLDTGTAITLSAGDGGSTARYLSASTIAQTGAAPVDTLLKTGYGFVYTADDTIDILVAAAPTTFAAGTIRMSVTYLI